MLGRMKNQKVHLGGFDDNRDVNTVYCFFPSHTHIYIYMCVYIYIYHVNRLYMKCAVLYSFLFMTFLSP